MKWHRDWQLTKLGMAIDMRRKHSRSSRSASEPSKGDPRRWEVANDVTKSNITKGWGSDRGDPTLRGSHVQAAREQDNAGKEEPRREDAAGCSWTRPYCTETDRERMYEVVLRRGLPPSDPLLAICLLLSPVFEAVCTKGAKRDAEKAENSSEQKRDAFYAPSMA